MGGGDPHPSRESNVCCPSVVIRSVKFVEGDLQSEMAFWLTLQFETYLEEEKEGEMRHRISFGELFGGFLFLGWE